MVRYLFVLLVAGAEAAAVFGADQVRSGGALVGAISLGAGVALVVASVAMSRASRHQLRSRLANLEPPPPGLPAALLAVAVATFALGAYAVADADGQGLGHAVLRACAGIWMLCLSSGSSIALYHLRRDIRRS